MPSLSVFFQKTRPARMPASAAGAHRGWSTVGRTGRRMFDGRLATRKLPACRRQLPQDAFADVNRVRKQRSPTTMIRRGKPKESEAFLRHELVHLRES